MSEVTRVLKAIEDGHPQAAGDLLPLVYDELRKLAACRMAREAPGQTLQPTALVHEAWLRLTANEHQQWNGRAHFFGAAAEAMRRILVDNARRKRAVRHGGGQQRVDVEEIAMVAPAPDEQLLQISEALDKLAVERAQHAELVKLRFFAGMSIEEAAQVLGISEATAKRWWAYARAWLLLQVKDSNGIKSSKDG